MKAICENVDFTSKWKYNAKSSNVSIEYAIYIAIAVDIKIMKSLLREVTQVAFRIPKVGEGFEEVWQSYAVERVKRGLDPFKGESELQAIISSEQLASRTGAFGENDAKALAKVVQMVIKRSIMIAEVGSWTGMSTAVLAKSVADYQGSVFCH